jgi:NAD(P)-dependent dehydrogenase (short-subunit alcohol dehydrogenase family)
MKNVIVTGRRRDLGLEMSRLLAAAEDALGAVESRTCDSFWVQSAGWPAV